MRSPPVWLMRSTAALALALALWANLALLSIGRGNVLFQLFLFQISLVALVLGVVVWLVAPRQPDNPLISVVVLAAVACGIYAAGIGTGIWLGRLLGVALDPRTAIPATIPRGLATLTAVCDPFWILGVFTMLTFGLLLFPDGRLSAPRWHSGSVLAVLGLTLAMAGDLWDMRPGGTRPYDVVAANPNPVLLTGFGLLLLAVIISLAAFITRFRQSERQTRQQFKWVGVGTIVLAMSIFAGLAFDDPLSPSSLTPTLLTLGITSYLSAYGVAIARYRLYDADLVVNRTMVFGVLAGFITAVYALVVVGIGSVIGSDSSLVLSVLATALVALVFEPVRVQAQKWANRLVYGNRSSPYEVLSSLTEKLAATESLEGLLERMVERLADGTGAERATVWLADEGALVVGASSLDVPPDASAIDNLPGWVFPIVDDEETLGAFSVEKRRGDSLSPTEDRLARDLAASAGIVLRNARLNTDLAIQAKELRESRRRLVDAQDIERRRMERDLQDGPQQLVKSLESKLDLAESVAREEPAEPVIGLVDQMHAHAEDAIEQIRQLSRGIYPPRLETDGLEALGTISERFPGVSVQIGRVGRLRPDVELAIWFIVSEAVTNAIKHGKPPISVEVGRAGHDIVFEVSDSGPGFDQDEVEVGSGLINMRDRIEVVDGNLTIEAEHGTRIRGSIPIQAVPAGSPV